ncbi:DUF1453 domain-containing protein [Kitasatospora sp. NPDC093102]|uniref:DUF1453 domain-containing protein n=1 Tax=Kitasatospora sp. NPDC093102 TaxID=3155069 RepID=UPI0034339841
MTKESQSADSSRRPASSGRVSASLAQRHGLGPAGYGWIAAGAALGVALGAVRGATIRVYEREGVLWQRYTGRTFLVAALSLGVMAGFAALAAHFGLAPEARPVQLSIGVGFLGEALVVGFRAVSSGTPFAPERRAPWDVNPLDRFRR